MSEQTLFEQIVEGEIPSYTVYEDETTYAFLDVNPLAPGHTLVIPKEPYERLDDMPPEAAADVFGVVGEIAAAVETAVDADATTIAINNGEAAGQEVPHVHWHVVPQFEDGTGRPIHVMFDGAELSDDEMETVAERIRNNQ
jgi:Diadenosine tetraphosphate (Ap4A) hydrolase and other HIT family hydrolases